VTWPSGVCSENIIQVIADHRGTTALVAHNCQQCPARAGMLNTPTKEFKEVLEHFVGNFDESCLLGNDGCVKVVASMQKSKGRLRSRWMIAVHQSPCYVLEWHLAIKVLLSSLSVAIRLIVYH
jgi:hypothetical protein